MTSPLEWFLRRLAALIVRGPDAPFILGDLDEQLRRDLERGDPRVRALGRYLRNALASSWTLAGERVGSLARRVPLPGVSILDVKLAFRMLVKHPGLTAVAIFALTLGIPASLYPFHFLSILDAPMPFEEGERIVGLRHSYRDELEEAPGTIHEYLAWRDALGGVEDIGAAARGRYNLATDDGNVSPWRGAVMTASAFRLLRVPPLLGRPLLESDEVIGAPDVVVLGFEAWRSLFGGDADAVGRTVRVGGVPHTVVGVMPDGFVFPSLDHLWLPLRADPFASPAGAGPELLIFARLADGVSRGRLLSQMRVIDRRLTEEDPDVYGRLRPEVVPYPYLETGNPVEAKWILLPFQALALVLLAVACGNVGTLVLARMAARSSEVAVRTALGASRARIVSQIFVESLLLALIATGLGLALAQLAAAQFGRVEAWAERPFWMDFGLRPATVAQGLALAVFSAVFAGVLPALKATSRSIQGNLQRTSAGGSGVRFGRMTTVLIVAEVALGVGCLFAGAVSWQYVPAAGGAIPEIPLDRYLSARLVMGTGTQTGGRDEVGAEELRARVASVQEELSRRVAAEPGVRGVAVASVLPGQQHPTPRVEVQGMSPPERSSDQQVMRARVGVGFFETLGRPILGGRAFTAGDLPETLGEDADVVIVNTAFAKRVLGGRDPVGQRIRYLPWSGGEPGPWLEIVGVVGSLGMVSTELADDAGVYHPLAPGELHPVPLAIHTGNHPEAFVPRLRAIAAEIDPTALIEAPRPLSQVVSADRALMRWGILGIAVVAGIAVVLSVAGLYALMSFTVAQRTREIGVRTALGADVGAIMGVVVRRALFQLTVGILIAVAACTAVITAALSDPIGELGVWLWQLVGSAGVMLLIGLGACVPPMRRGLRIRPVDALKV